MRDEPLRILFCSSDAGFAEAVEHALGPGFQVEISKELPLPAEGEAQSHEVLLLDLQTDKNGTGISAGLQFLQQTSQSEQPIPAVAILAADDRATALKLMDLGSCSVLHSPPDILELRLALQRARRFHQLQKDARQVRVQGAQATEMHSLVGVAGSLRELYELAQKIAPCDVTVLLTGETGTGKELWARAIHRMSSRASQPFVAFSCTNLPETLIEDELFGHEKGAFTGASLTRRGRFEIADHSTLFLDEIGDLSLGLQPKLLRVLQERTFERLGGSKPMAVDIRLICATHQNLAEMVERGQFRDDLYYRLNVVQLHLPPLRERRDDIPELASRCLLHFAKQFGKKAKRFSRLALQALEEYSWPGNVRELENVVQRAVVLAEGSTIELWHLSDNFRKGASSTRPTSSYSGEVRDFKRRLILRTLHQCGWRKTETARTLGMARNYLHRLINQLEIRPQEEDVLGEMRRPLAGRPDPAEHGPN
jgi:two-component system NtrC family response regulator